jgi:prepilin-type N-terminal cleavage/methylation domain-containing protein
MSHPKCTLRHKSQAFTLIELLVVIAVIAILAALLILRIEQSMRRARNASAFNTVDQVQKGMGIYAVTALESDTFISNQRMNGDNTDYLHSDGSGTLPQLFTGELSPTTYPTKIVTTPGKNYEYSYFAPPKMVDGSTNRDIMHNGIDSYSFCATYLDPVSAAPNAYCTSNSTTGIPGTVEMRNYDLGPEGTAYHEGLPFIIAGIAPGWIQLTSTSDPYLMVEPINLACVIWGADGNYYRDAKYNGWWIFHVPLVSTNTNSTTWQNGQPPCWRGWNSGPDIECGTGEAPCALSYFQAGEWVNYTVNISQTGLYQVSARVAAQGAGGVFHLELDGAMIGGFISAPNTGGWGTYINTNNQTIQINTAGKHVLKVVADVNGSSGAVANVSEIYFTKL